LKIRGWAADNGGCRYYRLTVPLAELARRGHDTAAGIRYERGWDDADVVVGARTCNPGPSTLWRRWAAEGRRLVLDIDDDYFSVDPASPAWGFFGRGDVQERLRENAALAAAVTVCTPRLREVMLPYNPNTLLVPNGLPTRLLGWQVPRRDEVVTLGWAGTATTLPDLAVVAGKLRRFLERHPNCELHTIGIPAAEIAATGLRHERVQVTPWVDGTEDYLRAVDFDIWVAPYRPIAFNAAKAPTKALEASFLGIPIVASDVGQYRTHVRPDVTGLLVSRDHEWDLALHELVADPDLRDRMSVAARTQAADHTIEAIAPRWEFALGADPGAEPRHTAGAAPAESRSRP
jgi:glycosyltransferase involved in cell wall biosynthesis